MVLRPNLDIVMPEYLAWAINQPDAQRYFARMGGGTVIRMIPRSVLDDLRLDIPDIETQRRIATVDNLSKRERALTLLLAEKRRKFTSQILGERSKHSSCATESNNN